MPPRRWGGLYHGWIVVATLCITETVTWGIVYYGFPVFLRAMEEQLGASRLVVTGAFSVSLGISALAALPVGRWLDRRGPWGLMTLGSCLATVLVVAWSRVDSVAGLYVVWAFMGLAMAATLYEPAFGAVVLWFRTERRDMALTTVTLVAALASTIFMPIAAWLLERLGWRTALLVLAAVLGAITIPLHAIVLRRPVPSISAARADGADRVVPGVTVGEATRTVMFWVLTAAFVVGNFSTISVTTHLIPHLTAGGWSAPLAASVIGWMGAMQVPGRLLFVAVVSRLGARRVAAAVFASQAIGIGSLAVAPALPGGVALGIVLLGASNGMATLARATSIADLFGPRFYASISGAVALGANGARAVGPAGASLLFDALGSYERVFGVLALALVAGAVAVALATRERPATKS